MAGKAYGGGLTNRWSGREQKAYCEGMTYRSTAAAVAVPITNNPYIGKSNAANLKTAWDAGWNFAQKWAQGSVPAKW